MIARVLPMRPKSKIGFLPVISEKDPQKKELRNCAMLKLFVFMSYCKKNVFF